MMTVRPISLARYPLIVQLMLTHIVSVGNLLRITDLVPVSLETAMANYKVPGLSQDEIKDAANFIRTCLKLDYMERATAQELKDHSFLANALRC